MPAMTPERRAQLIELAHEAHQAEPDQYESDEEHVFSLICELVEIADDETDVDEHQVQRNRAMIVQSVLENVAEGWYVTHDNV